MVRVDVFGSFRAEAQPARLKNVTVIVTIQNRRNVMRNKSSIILLRRKKESVVGNAQEISIIINTV
jgi:hypothetical protein